MQTDCSDIKAGAISHSCTIHFSSDGKETLMNRTDKRNDTGFSARKLGQQSWTDGQMFVLVYMETNATVFTPSGTEWAKPAHRGEFTNTRSQKGTLRRKRKPICP